MVKDKIVPIRLSCDEYLKIRREACLNKISVSEFIRVRLFQDDE